MAPHKRTWFPGGERVALFVALLGTLYAAYLTTRPVLLILVIAAALASLTFRYYRVIVRLLRGRSRLAAVLSVLLLFIGVLGPLTAGFTYATERLIAELAELAQELGKQGRAGLTDVLAQHLGPLGPKVGSAVESLVPQITDAIPALAQRAGLVVSQVGHALFAIGIGVFLLAVALYYFYLHGPAWRDRLIRILPLPARDLRLFMTRFRQVSAAVLIGNVGTAAAQGAVATIGYVIFGAPMALLWGFVTTLAALIPLVGSWLVWLPLSFYVGSVHGWHRGLFLGLYGALVVGTIDNVVRPLLTRKGLQLHPLLAFVAIFGGVASFGLSGLFIGPLVMAVLITMLEIYEQQAVEVDPAE